MVTTTHLTKRNIEIILGVEIPLQSGIVLRGRLYKPKHNTKPLPVLLAPTVYAADGAHEWGCHFAQNDYIFIAFEVTGRGNSGGTFELWSNNGKEGYEVVAWAAQQPWSNGQVGMWGASYNGLYQWATLKEHPVALATIIPISPVCPGVDFPAPKNIMYNYAIHWLAFIDGKTTNVNLLNDENFFDTIYYDFLYTKRPYRELDQACRISSPLFNILVQQPSAAVWHSLLPEREHYEAITIPILTTVGQYDGDQLGGLHYYGMHMRYGIKEWTEHHYLIIGPWDHAGTRTPSTNVGGLKVDEVSSIDMNQLHIQWYNWILRNRERPAFLQDRVAYYVTGAEEWRYANTLDSIPITYQRLYPSSPLSVTHDIFHSGDLPPELPTGEHQTTYSYDTRDLRAAELGGLRVESWVVDQSHVVNIAGNGLIFHSTPFTDVTEIIGFPRFVAWFSLNVSDVDFQVTVYEICPDGTSILLSQDLMRARYRHSLMEETLVIPGTIEQYEFSSFRFVARRLAKGSRLRLVICAPDILFWQRNYSGGGVVEDETAEDGRLVCVTLHQDVDHQSFLALPILNGVKELNVQEE
jgi:uncharacterized protein